MKVAGVYSRKGKSINLFQHKKVVQQIVSALWINWFYNNLKCSARLSLPIILNNNCDNDNLNLIFRSKSRRLLIICHIF